MKLFKILEKLIEKKVAFCLQSRGEQGFYNLKVVDPKGKEHYFHREDIEDIELALEVIWGHILHEKPAMSLPVPKMGIPSPGHKPTLPPIKLTGSLPTPGDCL